MFDNRREIMQDVFLTYLPAQRFKTSRMTVQLIAPLQRETAAANALLPAVLRRGTVRCPDMESLSAALDTLYGANIDYTVRKKGERQCVGFAAGFIDDAFTPHGEKLLEPVSAMLGELLLDPVTHGGRFLSSYVESEKANLINAIRGLKNDKRDWADIRLMQEMCAGEPYSVLRLGDEETAGRITNQSLYVHGQALMASSRVEVIYCGSAETQRVEDAVLTALAALPRGAQTALPEVQRIQAPDTPRRIVETMDVTQGKLAMGYRCSSDDYPAMVLANLIFGGTSNSKLFLNVRERLSLCYYASSSYARSKNILTVSSGVETAEMLPETGQPEKLKLSTIKKPHGRIRLSPEYWQFSARIVAARVSPATGIHAPVHRRSRSCSVMSRLSASPLAGSVYEISVTKPEISAVAAVPL